MPVTDERLVANRDLRVEVGDDGEIVEVKLGESWPANANGRLDVLVRNGYVIRWENGELDPRSWPFAKRLGIPRAAPAPVRGFLARARALEQTTRTPDGRRIRVFAGRPDGAETDLFVVGGKAFPVFRGAPDSLAASEALRASIGGDEKTPRRRGRSSGNGKRRRRRQPKA